MPAGRVAPSPGHGEHTAKVLATLLGMSAAEIEAIFPAGGVFSGDRADFEAGLAAGPGKDLLAAAVKRAALNAVEAEALFQKLWPPAGGM